MEYYQQINPAEMQKTTFVPMLSIKRGTLDLDFYKDAFGAIETKLVTNDDGSIHVSEMFIDGAMLHFHEESFDGSTFSPEKYNGITTTIGLFVDDVDSVISRALEAGALEISPAQDYDYGYRQGTIIDPLGHQWIIEKIL